MPIEAKAYLCGSLDVLNVATYETRLLLIGLLVGLLVVGVIHLEDVG